MCVCESVCVGGHPPVCTAELKLCYYGDGALESVVFSQCLNTREARWRRQWSRKLLGAGRRSGSNGGTDVTAVTTVLSGWFTMS